MLLPLLHASHVEVYRDIFENSFELSINTPILPSGVSSERGDEVCDLSVPREAFDNATRLARGEGADSSSDEEQVDL